MNTKVQRKFYITKTLADILRIEAAKRNESQSAIVERAVRKELGIDEHADKQAEPL